MKNREGSELFFKNIVLSINNKKKYMNFLVGHLQNEVKIFLIGVQIKIL